MDVFQALHQRRSVRAFLPQAPSADTVRTLMEAAARAASGGNLQPWRVLALTGEPLAQVVAAVAQAEPDHDAHLTSYPASLWEPYRTRRFANGEALYRSIGVAREDKAGRLEQLAKNAEFFGAPVGLFICVDQRMGQAQWVDLGIYLQSLMLAAVDKGLATCPQGFWRRYDRSLTEHLQLPQPYRVAFGVALGYEDTTASINSLQAGAVHLCTNGPRCGAFDLHGAIKKPPCAGFRLPVTGCTGTAFRASRPLGKAQGRRYFLIQTGAWWKGAKGQLPSSTNLSACWSRNGADALLDLRLTRLQSPSLPLQKMLHPANNRVQP